MQNLMTIWNGLDTRRKAVMAAATLGVFVAILLMARIVSQPQLDLLYSGLPPDVAGEVVSALEAEAVVYEVRGTGIYVEAGARDRLRLSLAGQGLPGSNGVGYELLDSMTGFGTTSQMFDAAYWRAKEGELARTIAAGGAIKSARVHIATPTSSPFQRESNLTASVTVQTTQGRLPVTQARAIQSLVASAVAGLTPEDVAVIDGASGAIVSADDSLPGGVDQDARAAALQRSVERLLAARVGHDRVVVEVTVETDRDAETIIQRTLDPETRVVISTDTEEHSTQSNGSGSGAVTVASNLPEGDAGASSQSSSQDSSTRERVNYDISVTQRELHKGPGAIKRITVAVLVDGTRTTSDTGEVEWTPRTAEELASLEELVRSAVGFDADRGDVVTIKSLAFDTTADVTLGTTADAGWGAQFDITTIVTSAFLALAVLAAGIFVVRPILAAQPMPNGAAAGQLPGPQVVAADRREMGPGDSDLPSLPDLPMPGLTGQIEDGDAPFQLPDMAVVGDFEMPTFGGASQDGSGPPIEDVDPVERLRQLIEDRRDETVEILRSWMEESEEDAT